MSYETMKMVSTFKIDYANFEAGPIDVFSINNIHALIYKNASETTFIFAETNSQITFLTPFEYQNHFLYPIGPLLIFYIPKKFIAIIDSSCDNDYVFSYDERLCQLDFETKIIKLVNKPKIVFLEDKLQFAFIDIKWDLLYLFLDGNNLKTWQFVAHILTYSFISNYAAVLIPQAIHINMPHLLIPFISEYAISNIYQLLLKDFNPSQLAYVSYRFTSNNSFKQIHENLLRPYFDELLKDVKISEMQMSSELLTEYDKHYSPNGFTSMTFISILLLFALNNKIPQSKLPYPICETNFPLFNFITPSNETRKAMKDVKMKNFEITYFVKMIYCIENIPKLPVEIDYLDLLRSASIFQSAKYDTLPYSEKEFQKFQKLARQMFPTCAKLFLARFGCFQKFEGQDETEIKIWMRSSSAQTAPQINSYFPPPKLAHQYTDLEAEDNNLFEPLEKCIKIAALNDKIIPPKMINSYSFENLESLYC
ncbi:hypothetical protein TVAG_161810 [Trichomonas vaginalis G3]|uniref:Uncharacterized protein n=1 Tax=Trichomonas vaginalis (strain ATCC PRA-98 / G3) TaxID=412133 RepID=A2EUQ4_TRIV3|nr:hypothetical protein TVAGG3_0255910 [Trichomonas vaginalis G3]EAY03642.1 hypothetical protein TVAG_161810 [Trichomonas vaginalis G3]KAI5524736.1 hypothetical protein TVAGG3_0255910 [Trichomonas vaginalis G3]|eukprot:XP_001315865.1 hypothetical protein [Trichomonas vaginalis G3]